MLQKLNQWRHLDKIGKIDGIQNTETFVELEKTDKTPVYLSKN